MLGMHLGQPRFIYDMACGGFKDLTWKTTSDRMLGDKGFEIANNPKHDEYQRGLQWFRKFLIKQLRNKNWCYY